MSNQSFSTAPDAPKQAESPVAAAVNRVESNQKVTNQVIDHLENALASILRSRIPVISACSPSAGPMPVRAEESPLHAELLRIGDTEVTIEERLRDLLSRLTIN